MKIAIATEAGQVCPHFGHTPFFTFAVVEEGVVVEKKEVPNPGHEPGFLPKWMKEQGVQLIITGGVGSKAQELFKSLSIEVIAGASGPVEKVLAAFVDGTLTGGKSLCTHDAEKPQGCSDTCH